MTNLKERSKKMDKRYIHYNSDTFDKERLKRALTHDKKYRRRDKPFGLWASPVNAELGWKEWCEDEEWRLDKLDESFEFSLSPEAKILTINKLEDAADFLLELRMHGIRVQALDLPMIYDRYDAMEVNMSNDFMNFHDNEVFYSWDVDSIVIWNPDIIVV